MASASDVALQAAIDGNLLLLEMMASEVNLREAKDDDGRNALHLAAVNGHLEVCRFLVERSGLDVNSVSAGGGRPVHGAAAGGSESVLKYLLDRGGDPVMPNSTGLTPLHFAAVEGHCEAVRLLLSKGADVDAISSLGTPLHLAASKDKDQVLKILLEHGAVPNKVVNQFSTPLLMACCGARSLKCAKLLVEAGADVNFISPDGPVILMGAVDDGLTDIVKFLLEAGADPNIADKDGRIPITWAAVHEQPDPKSKGNEAFAKGDYFEALYLYGLAAAKRPCGATLYANLSICWVRLGEGEEALQAAWKCKEMRPGWSKAWYREGAALSFLKNYKGSVDAFTQALKLTLQMMK